MPGLTIVYVLTAFVYSAEASSEAISIYVAGGEAISDVRAIIEDIIEDGVVFISIEDISEKLDIVSKDIGEGTIGLCKGDVCILVQLDNEEETRRDSGALMINVDLIAQTLGSTVEWVISGKALRFVPEDQVILDNLMKVGDVVPDFALPSITDNTMVPFSGFRGKRVLLFLWASW